MKLIILLLMVSCGKIKTLIDDKIEETKDSFVRQTYVVKKTDPTFTKYINMFQNSFKRKVTSVIVFANINKKYAGYCTEYYDGFKLIEIHPDHWQSSNEYQREQLMLHEFGHCELDLEHNNEVFLNGCPRSVMFPSVFSDNDSVDCFYEYKQYYMNELINKE